MYPVAELPRPTDILPAESVKLGAETPRVRVVLAVSEPEVPVIVSVAVPEVAVLLAVSVSALVPVVGFGAKDAVTPLGKPVTARFTLPLNPYWENTLTDVDPELPSPMFTLAAERVKLGA